MSGRPKPQPSSPQTNRVRVCCCSGSWQLLMLAAALKQHGLSRGEEHTFCHDILLLYGADRSQALRTAVETLATRIWPWQQVHWLGIPEIDEKLKLVTKHQFDDYKVSLKRCLDADTCDELWITKFWDRPGKFFIEAYPQANIYIYEDGLHDYVSHAPIGTSRLRNLARNTVADVLPHHRVRKTTCSPWQMRRIVAAYLYLVRFFPASWPMDLLESRTIENATMASVFEAASMAATPHARPPVQHDRSALVLGQAFSHMGLMQRQDEFVAYQRSAELLIKSGYHVIWKDHPRVEHPFFKDLQASFGDDISICPVAQGYPIEPLAMHLGVSVCVSAFSSSLFYLKGIYGMPVYTYAEYVQDGLRAQFRVMCDMLTEHIPGIETLATEASIKHA